jgi:hypothetical protein
MPVTLISSNKTSIEGCQLVECRTNVKPVWHPGNGHAQNGFHRVDFHKNETIVVFSVPAVYLSRKYKQKITLRKKSMLRWQFDRNSLGLHVAVQRIDAKFSAQTGLLETTKWCLRCNGKVAVNPEIK